MGTHAMAVRIWGEWAVRNARLKSSDFDFSHWAGVTEAEALFETGISSISALGLAHL